MRDRRPSPRHTFALASAALMLGSLVLGSGAAAAEPAPPEAKETGASSARGKKVPELPLHLNGGSWATSHVQGIAVDQKQGYVYYSFTTLLVKTDLTGKVLGTVDGFTGHLGDLDFNERDGRVYGSLEYKEAEAFYIAIFDVDAIDEIGIDAQNSDVVTTVYLQDVVDDYTADMDGDGVFDGNVGDTADHRYGSSGIDGVSFGPKFGSSRGPDYLTVAYGIYSNVDRDDNDNQVLLQYKTSGWRHLEQPLTESAPHTSGPRRAAAKYFVHTGNTRYGVQNLEYDEYTKRWFMGVYAGAKPEFPNYSLFAVDAETDPQYTALPGLGGEKGELIALADDGLSDSATGIRGWDQKADVGLESLGGGLFYLSVDSRTAGLQTSDLTLSRWTGDPDAPFVPVDSE